MAPVAALFALATLPWWIPDFWLSLIASSIARSLVVLSVVVLARATASISLAQGAFMGLSAYLGTWLFTEQGWAYLPAAALGVVAVVPIGLALALPALRLRGLELSVLTLTVGLAAAALVFNPGAPFTVGTGGTGAILTRPIDAPGIDLTDGDTMYWFQLAVAAVVFVAVWLLLRGRVGHTWQAMRAGNAVAAASGIDITRYQLLGFGIAAAIAGLSGVMLLTVQRSVTPESVGPAASIFLVVTAVVVGIDRLRAAMVGGIALGAGVQVFPTFGLKGDWLTLMLGLLVVVAVVVRDGQRRRVATA